MQLRNRKGHKVSGLGRSGAVLLLLSAASLPLAAQNVNQILKNARQQADAPAGAKPAGQVQQPVHTPAAPATPKPAAQVGQPQPAPAANVAGAPEAKLVALRTTTGPRRDPFSSLIGKDKIAGVPDHLPPGKAGLVIATLRVDGIVQGPNGMIAIVSNAQGRVYFLRDGDRLYDGQVDKIRLDGVSFHQSGKDPFGKPVERQIDKRLYPTPGEQQ
jgi:hypothetical protein